MKQGMCLGVGLNVGPTRLAQWVGLNFGLSRPIQEVIANRMAGRVEGIDFGRKEQFNGDGRVRCTGAHVHEHQCSEKETAVYP